MYCKCTNYKQNVCGVPGCRRERGVDGCSPDLGMLSSTVAHPYRKTMTPTTDAGISICVYRPSHAKYRPIFSPKYFLENSWENKVDIVCVVHDITRHLPEMCSWLKAPGCGVLTVRDRWAGICRRRCSWPTPRTKA